MAVVVLAGLTGYYAWQTHRTADEMKKARLLSLLPKIAADVLMISPVHGLIVARNVGAGPAFDCDLHLHFADAKGTTIDHRRWLVPVMAPGEQHQFLPPEEVHNISTLVNRYPLIRLVGHVSNVSGERHPVALGAADVHKMWRTGARKRPSSRPGKSGPDLYAEVTLMTTTASTP